MGKTIFNCYIEVESQEQANRLREICVDNDLKIWDDFLIIPKNSKKEYKYFYCSAGDFCNWLEIESDLTKVTEQEFLQLLKEYKDGNK